jgi:hypothetical protein
VGGVEVRDPGVLHQVGQLELRQGLARPVTHVQADLGAGGPRRGSSPRVRFLSGQ